VARLFEALRYEPENGRFDFWWRIWGVIGNFHLTSSSRLHCGPGVDSAPGRNLYQAYFFGGKGSLCAGLTTLPPSCVDFLKIPEALNYWIPEGFPRLVDGPLLLPRRGKPRYRPNAHWMNVEDERYRYCTPRCRAAHLLFPVATKHGYLTLLGIRLAADGSVRFVVVNVTPCCVVQIYQRSARMHILYLYSR